jgi:predicted kinase
MLKTRRREQLLIAACLAGQQPFVVDNTNVRAADRAQYIAMAKSSRFRVVGYFLHTELREAIRRNVKRPGKQAIPVRGVVGTFKRVEPPSLEEGFDELYRVRIAEDSSFVVEPWNAA